MNRTAELFGDELMGYSAKEPQLGGFSGSLAGERVTSSILPGMEWDLSRMSGGARRSRKTRAGSRKTRAGSRKTQRGGGQETQSRVDGLNYMDRMMLPQTLNYKRNEKVVPVTHVGAINWRETSSGVPMTPQRSLGVGIGNSGFLPSEEKKAPDAPVKQKLQFGGGRRSLKMRKYRKVHKAGRNTQKSLINLRITGRIQMKQRHRQ